MYQLIVFQLRGQKRHTVIFTSHHPHPTNLVMYTPIPFWNYHMSAGILLQVLPQDYSDKINECNHLVPPLGQHIGFQLEQLLDGRHRYLAFKLLCKKHNKTSQSCRQKYNTQKSSNVHAFNEFLAKCGCHRKLKYNMILYTCEVIPRTGRRKKSGQVSTICACVKFPL